jgi:cyclic pyranopterin phosphate synthase
MSDPRPIPVLRDGRQRRISYLRLSITDRCDLRCRYCMPASGERWLTPDQRLTDAELLTVARVATELGIRKIRVTGGEPLLHPRVAELLEQLRALPGLERLVLTTNGLHLGALAGRLRSAGIEGVNVSLDSLQAGRYAEITRGGDLARCLAGIDAALAAGLRTKINVVVMRGVNDDEVGDFVQLARRRPLAVRFIEYMPSRGGESEALTVPSEELLARIAADTPLEAQPHEPGQALAGPARNYRLPGSAGTVGVISPVSEVFCAACNRIRVRADGQARGCLFRDAAVDLRPLLRAGDQAGLARTLRELIARKPARHDLRPDGSRTDRGDDDLRMSRMGG